MLTMKTFSSYETQGFVHLFVIYYFMLNIRPPPKNGDLYFKCDTKGCAYMMGHLQAGVAIDTSSYDTQGFICWILARKFITIYFCIFYATRKFNTKVAL